MAKMKIEFLHHYHARHGLPLKDGLIAYLPRYAPVAPLAPLLNLRDRIPAVARATERWLGLASRRALPKWGRPWRQTRDVAQAEHVVGDGRDLILFADTFNRYYERENLEAAERVLEAAGYRLHRVAPEAGPSALLRAHLLVRRPRRSGAAGGPPYARRPFSVRRQGGPRRGARTLLSSDVPRRVRIPSADARGQAVAQAAVLFEESLGAGSFVRPRVLGAVRSGRARGALHGHCHQKAFGVMTAVETVLKSVPGLDVHTIESSCCGMSGAFGYGADTIEVSFAMAELSLLPAVRKASPEDLVLADGTSCRHQIHDGAGRDAVHVARALEQALEVDDRRPAIAQIRIFRMNRLRTYAQHPPTLPPRRGGSAPAGADPRRRTRASPRSTSSSSPRASASREPPERGHQDPRHRGSSRASAQSGCAMASVSADEVEEMIEVIAGLEATAADLACRSITDQEVAAIETKHHAMVAAWNETTIRPTSP